MPKDEKTCFFVSVGAGLLHKNGITTPKDYKRISKKKNKDYKAYLNMLILLMRNIITLAGIDIEKFVKHQLPGPEEFDKIQQVLQNYTVSTPFRVTNACYQLVIYTPLGQVLYTGTVNCDPARIVTLNLLFDSQHYDFIKSLTGVFAKTYFCQHCRKGYSDKTGHRNCLYSCSACFQNPPCSHRGIADTQYIYCNECERRFYDQTCFNNHKGHNICKYVRYCKYCGNFKKKNHKCGIFYCKMCKKDVELEHYCNIAVYKPQIFNVKGHFYIFFDLETMTVKTERRGLTFVPVLCVSQIVCDSCMHVDSTIYNCTFCGERQKVFRKDTIDDVMGHFLRYVYEIGKKARVTAISHNGSKFDSVFVLNKMYSSNCPVEPFIVAQGTKLFMIKVGNIRFIDSLNFFPAHWLVFLH